MLIKCFRLVTGLYFFVSLAGCGMSAEKAVAESAQKRWDYLIAGDLEQSYHYYTDAFKETTSYRNYRNMVRGVGLWNRAKVEEVSCDDTGGRCQVMLSVTVSMKMRGLPKPVETTDVIAETWIKEGWFSDWRYIKE